MPVTSGLGVRKNLSAAIANSDPVVASLYKPKPAILPDTSVLTVN